MNQLARRYASSLQVNPVSTLSPLTVCPAPRENALRSGIPPDQAQGGMVKISNARTAATLVPALVRNRQKLIFAVVAES